jgi:hypothetical protein
METEPKNKLWEETPIFLLLLTFIAQRVLIRKKKKKGFFLTKIS